MDPELDEAEAVVVGLCEIELICGCGAKKMIPICGFKWTCECGTVWIIRDRDRRFSTPK